MMMMIVFEEEPRATLCVLKSISENSHDTVTVYDDDRTGLLDIACVLILMTQTVVLDSLSRYFFRGSSSRFEPLIVDACLTLITDWLI